MSGEKLSYSGFSDDKASMWDSLRDADEDAEIGSGENNETESSDDVYDDDDHDYDDGDNYDDVDEWYDEGDDVYDDDDRYYSSYEEEHWGAERSDVNEDLMELTEIPLPPEILERYAFIGELPHGVAVMGGVARSIAREVITGEREPIRDIDLVNIVDEDGHSDVENSTLDELARKYMPDDYAFGHGVQSETLEHYFKTRDFTINQCLVMDGKLVVSDLAYYDFEENIIRPTYYEHSHEGDPISSRLFLKALLMCGVTSQISDYVPVLEDMPEPRNINEFDIALFLNKAMSRGAETARIFVHDLVDWNVINKQFDNHPMALARYLSWSIFDFHFRPSADEQFMEVEECKDMDGYFAPETMMEYHANNPKIRNALAEYDDEDAYKDYLRSGHSPERLAGHYTSEEYEAINLDANDYDWREGPITF